MASMRLVVSTDHQGRVYVARLVGDVEIEVDKEILHKALRKAAQLYMFRNMGNVGADGVEGDYVGGFWQTLNKGFQAIGSITKIPLVRSIITAIPFGGTALTALDLAGSAVAIGNQALSKVPKPARMLAQAAAKGPKGRAMLASIAQQASAGNPGAAKLMNDVTLASNLMRDVTDLRGAMRKGSIDTAPEDGGGEESPDVGGDFDEFPAPPRRRRRLSSLSY